MPITVYCDENFGPGDKTSLEHQGASLGLRVELAQRLNVGAADPFHLKYAARRRWVMLTTDIDYVTLHHLWCVFRYWRRAAPEHHAGILRAPNTATLTNADIIQQAAAFLHQHHGEVLRDRCWEFNAGTRQWRELPAFSGRSVRVPGLQSMTSRSF